MTTAPLILMYCYIQMQDFSSVSNCTTGFMKGGMWTTLDHGAEEASTFSFKGACFLFYSEAFHMYLHTLWPYSLKAKIYSGMHKQEKRSLKYWKQSITNTRTSSAEQVRCSAPPGKHGVTGGETKQRSGQGWWVWVWALRWWSRRYCWNKNRLLVRIKTFLTQKFSLKKRTSPAVFFLLNAIGLV